MSSDNTAPNLVATLLGDDITSEKILLVEKSVKKIIALKTGGKVDDRDLERVWLSDQSTQRQPRDRLQAIDIFFYSPSLGQEFLITLRHHERIRYLEGAQDIQIAIQPVSNRRSKCLAVFDMDSTLIQQEVIDELARAIGVEGEVSAITERAMNGELDFTASLRARVALLKGVPAQPTWAKLKSEVITFTPGARELCKILKAAGFKLAVLSGGFLPLAEWVKAELGLDYAYANNLESDDSGTLTGYTIGPVVDASRKALLLREIAEREGISLEQTVAIGDGANDLLMMGAAGIGVAFNAKEKVRLEAPTKLTTSSLVNVLYILGYSEQAQLDLLGKRWHEA